MVPIYSVISVGDFFLSLGGEKEMRKEFSCVKIRHGTGTNSVQLLSQSACFYTWGECGYLLCQRCGLVPSGLGSFQQFASFSIPVDKITPVSPSISL